MQADPNDLLMKDPVCFLTSVLNVLLEVDLASIAFAEAEIQLRVIHTIHKVVMEFLSLSVSPTHTSKHARISVSEVESSFLVGGVARELFPHVDHRLPDTNCTLDCEG